MNNIIISDTSCLIALQKIGLLNILRELYGEIIITPEVNQEFGKSLPSWIIIRIVQNMDKQSELEKILDKGEASSIALALEAKNTILIIDENKGRKIAKSLNLNIIGTIGVLLQAEKKGYVQDLIVTVLKLVNSGFHLSDDIIDKILSKYRKK
jgi:predicted nucleic acid-binding protein